MDKNGVVFFGVWPNTHKVVVDAVRHRSILYRADAPNRNAIVFDVVEEVLVHRIAIESIFFVELPDYGLYETFFPAASVVQEVDGKEHVFFGLRNDGVVAPNGILYGRARDFIDVPGFCGVVGGGESHDDKAVFIGGSMHKNDDVSVFIGVVHDSRIISPIHGRDGVFFDIWVIGEEVEGEGFDDFTGIVMNADYGIHYGDNFSIVSYGDMIVVGGSAARRNLNTALSFCDD